MMNKHYFLILFLFILSCGKAEKGQNLTIEPMVVTVLNEVASTVDLTVIISDGDWELSHYEPNNVPAWFEMTPLSGKVGESKVTIKVLAVNEDTLDRVGFINFKTKAITKTVTIKQLAPVPEVEPEETPEEV